MSAIGGFLETFDCWNMAPVKIDDSTVHLYGADLVAVRFVFRENYGKLFVQGGRPVSAADDLPIDEWGK